MPPLPALGQRGFAVSRKLVHMALEARSAVAARLVRGAEFLEIGATGLAHTHMAAFAACLSTTAWVGLAAHGGQAKKGDEEDGGFSHGTWLKRVVGTTSVATTGSSDVRRAEGGYQSRPAAGWRQPSALGKYKFKCYFKAIGGLFRLPCFDAAG